MNAAFFRQQQTTSYNFLNFSKSFGTCTICTYLTIISWVFFPSALDIEYCIPDSG